MNKVKFFILENFFKYPLVLFLFFKGFKILSRRIPIYKSDDYILDIINSNHGIEKSIPKIIWLFWNEEDIPSHIQMYIDRISKLNKNYNIVVLGFHNLHKYLRKFDFSHDTPIANQTDLIRLNLLYKYGGIWIDVSTIFNESLETIFPLLNTSHSYDLIAFYNEKSTVNYDKPIIESWFLAAPRENEFIRLWLKEFSKIELIGSKKLYNSICSRKNYKEIKQNISDPEYLLIYLTQQIVLLDKNNFNFYLKKCENSAFFYQNFYGWKPLKMHNLLINYEVSKISPVPAIIKLVSGDRKLLPILIKNNLVNKNSIIGKLMKR